MDLDTFYEYLECIQILSAQEGLVNLSLALATKTKRETLVKMHRDLTKTAYPSHFKEKKVATLEDIARILSGR